MVPVFYYWLQRSTLHGSDPNLLVPIPLFTPYPTEDFDEDRSIMWELNGGNTMLFGIVDSNWTKNTTGQEARDHIRCQALRKMSFTVKTIDDKHSDQGLQHHCQANFCDARRLKKSMDEKWGIHNQYSLDHVILDYFFSPVSTSSFLLISCWSNFCVSEWLGT